MARWLVVGVLVAACGGEGELQQSTIAHDAAIDAPMLSICAICSVDADCATGICKLYGDGWGKCSPSCAFGEAAPHCTGSSTGICNGMGYCMCPQYAPPDAGIGDDAQKDAGTLPIDAATVPIDGL
jgi:hypothetical protein